MSNVVAPVLHRKVGCAVPLQWASSVTLFHRGDELIRIKDVQLETEYEGITNYHRSLKARVTLENGEMHTVEGTVKGFIPLRNRRQGSITHIGEGMTEYVLDGERVGYGLSEYLDQLE